MSFVQLLVDVAGMISLNTHLKGVLDFRGIFDISFLFILEIYNDVQNVSGSTLRSIYWQTFAVSPYSNDLVDLCPNIWFNNSKETFLFWFCFLILNFLLFIPKMHVFFVRCAIMSPCSIHYHRRKLCKTLYEKVRYVPNSSTK